MTYHHGWAYIEDADGPWRELFNHARTAAYLSRSTALGCGTILNVLDDGGCEAYRWAPTADVLTEESTGTPLLDESTGEWLIEGDGISPTGWLQRTFTSPATDPAPWYNASFPESGQALGFWITEWTGLDSGHIQRQMTQRGNYGAGGTFGAMGSMGREMGFEVILLGESEAALDYLYRWLDATLSSVCATCATDTLVLRRTCPDVNILTPDTVLDGVVEMRGVGLIAGMQWGAPPVERAGCFIRRVNFTMGATDPCMYGLCTDVPAVQTINWDACMTAANLSVTRTNCRPNCSEMSSLCRTVFDYTINDPSGGAPIIELVPPDYMGATIPIRIRTYANPNNLTPAQLCGAPLLAELYVASLPQYTELRYDVPGRRVEIRNAGTGDWINGFGYLGPNDVGVPRFFHSGCGKYTTIVEPADFCLANKVALPSLTTLSTTTSKAVPLMGGGIAVAGSFTTVNGITVNGLVKLTNAGYIAPGFNIGGTVGVSAAGSIPAVVEQPDGKILIGGLTFTSARGIAQNFIARLNADGSLDTGFNTGGTIGVSAAVRAIALQPDGKILIGGNFITARGTVVNRIARLNADGSNDATFNVGGTIGVDGAVFAIAVQSNGKIIIGGDFSTARGTTVNQIARLNADGTNDGTFNIGGTIGVSSTVLAIAIQPDGKIVIGGDFNFSRGTAVIRLARLNADGTNDATFNIGGTIGVSSLLRAIAIQPDGQILIAGQFLTARGTIVNSIARLNISGTVDTTFNTGGTVGADFNIESLFLQSDGRIVIGGAFSNVRGVSRPGVARLLPNGSLDPSFYTLEIFGGYLAQPAAAAQVRARMGCA